MENDEFTLVVHIADQYHAFILTFLFSIYVSTCLTVENLVLISSIFTIDSIPLHAAKPPTMLGSSLPGSLRPGPELCWATSPPAPYSLFFFSLVFF